MTTTIVLASVRLATRHKPTKRTIHRLGNELLPVPSELRVVQHPGDPGFLLLYLDEHQQEITDTYHLSLQAALEQAEFEFGIKPDEWRRSLP